MPKKATTKPVKEKKPKTEDAPTGEKPTEKVLTQEDLDLNPALEKEGYKVGDTVFVEDENDTAANQEAVKKNELKPVGKNAVEVDVVREGQYIRTYSEAVHGEDFMELAKQFASKFMAQLIDPTGITVAVVTYRAIDKKGVSHDTTKAFYAKDGKDFKGKAVLFKNEVNGDSIIVK